MGSSRVFTAKLEAIEYTIYIDTEIGPVSDYREAINAINSATEHDLVRVIIDSTGGYTDTGVAIRSALLACKAPTEAVIVGKAYSAASLIALSCSSIIMYDHTSFMCHNLSLASGYDTLSNYKLRADFITKQAEDMAIDVYGGFLNDDELIEFLGGKDFWFTPDEVAARIANMCEVNE